MWTVLIGVVVTSVALSAESPVTDRSLFIMNADGTNVRKLIGEPIEGYENCGSPCWSPDGTRIAFDCAPGNQWGQAHILVVHVGGARQGDVDDLGLGVGPDWSPEGDRLSFFLNSGSIPGTPSGTYIMDDRGQRRERVSGCTHSRWASNGEFLLCATNFGQPVRLKIVDLQTKQEWPVAVDGYEFMSRPVFGADLTKAVVAARKGTKPCLLELDISVQPAAVVRTVTFPGKPVTQVIVSPRENTIYGVRWRDPKDLRVVRVDASADAATVEELDSEAAASQNKDPAFASDGRFIVFSSSRTDECPPFIETLRPEDLKLLKPKDE